MPMPSTYAEKTLREELNLTEGEYAVWVGSQQTSDHIGILLSKRIEALTKSSEISAKAMNMLTAGILFVAILQIVFAFWKP